MSNRKFSGRKLIGPVMILVCLWLMCGSTFALITQQPGTAPNSYQQAQINLKYGMFCHFGINTFCNQEWTDGTVSPSTYAPTGLDTSQWARTAYAAGMNYLICITKHHEGFSMWNSAYTTYDVASSSYTTDVVGAVSSACAANNIKFAVYYSLWDRHEPTYTSNFNPGYITYMKNQLTELLTNYGTVSEIWFDGSWDKAATDWKLDELYDLIKTKQPGCQMGVNWCNGHASEWYSGKPMTYFPSDFRLADPELPPASDPKLYTYGGQTYYLPFEATQCINRYWFYHTGDESATPKSAAEIQSSYNLCVSQSDNYVLNAAPDRSGRLMQVDKNRLYEAANAMGIARGEAIGYGPPTPTPGPYGPNLANNKPVTASNVYLNDAAYNGAKAVDANEGTRWATDSGVSNAWLEVNFGTNTTFNKTITKEGETYYRTTGYKIQYWNGSSWVDAYTGTTIGAVKTDSFIAVTASKVRLYITSASDGPTISEFEVYNSGGATATPTSTPTPTPTSTPTAASTSTPTPGGVPANGLVAYYPFNGNAGDSSGNGNNGTANGGASYVTGKVGQAISLDGVNGYVSVNDSSTLEMTNFTVAMWVNLTNLPSTNQYFALAVKTVSDMNENYELLVGYPNPGSVHFPFKWTDGTRVTDSSGTQLTAGVWTHVVLTYDGTSAKVYIDGTLNTTKTYSKTPAVNNGQLLIGNEAGMSRYTKGKIDEVRIYNRALSQSEVTSVYNYSG
jgi:alpha-L-fucosidase